MNKILFQRIFLNRVPKNRTISHGKFSEAEGLPNQPNPVEVSKDYIGPPNKESNLRPIVRCILKNETNLAVKLREKQIEVENWNQEFWCRHNKRFYEEKETFIKAHKANAIENISADKMSEFYKHFLDKNRKIHFYYNVSWYLKNFDLLILAGQVRVQSFWNKCIK